MLMIKVCGNKYPENIKAIGDAGPDMMGFIFYPGSPRCVTNQLTPEDLESLHPDIIKTGVFVNESTDEMLRIVKQYNLNAVQLHGSESPEICQAIKNAGYFVFKAFNISNDFDFELTEAYAPFCMLFVFDASGADHGGNGFHFNWEKLQTYKGKTAFLLSGGIEPDDINALKEMKHPSLLGLDINSKFETQPGEKDILKVKNFISNIRLSTIR